MTEGGVEAFNSKQLERLASYFDEEVISAKKYKISWAKFSVLLLDDARNVRWEPGFHLL